MLNPFYFTDRALQVGFKMSLESHHIKHANSKINAGPKNPEFGIEVRYINKIRREASVFHPRLTNLYNFKYPTIFSARFDKQDEKNQVLDETELFINLIIYYILPETNINNIDDKSLLKHQIQVHETKGWGWRFDKINSMKIYIFKTGEMNGRSYVKKVSRSDAILNIEKDDQCCFNRSFSAKLHLCTKNRPNSESN